MIKKVDGIPRTRFIDIPTDQFNNKIYRIISFERLLGMLDAKRNYLSSPSTWDDPFENVLLRISADRPGGERIEYGFRKKLFAQSWTMTSESDALWRIYSDKQGCQIITTIKTLIKSVWPELKPSIYIGKVTYLSQKDFNALITTLKNDPESLPINASNGVKIAKTLLLKRTAFKHEKEIRLIYFDSLKRYVGEKYIPYSIKPLELIDKFRFDPRISKALFNIYKNHLIDKYEIPEAKIKRSGLYTPSKLL